MNFGAFQVWNFSALRSNFAMPPWYIMPNQTFPSGSNLKSRAPVGAPGFVTGTAYSTALAVLGSSLPRYWEPKSEYQIMPSASMAASCGMASGRGRSYSVMITWLALPLGRGSAFSGYSHFETLLKLIVLKYCANLVICCIWFCDGSRAPGRTCGRSGELPWA